MCVWTIPVDCEGLCACVCVVMTCRFWRIVYMCVGTLRVDCGGLYTGVCRWWRIVCMCACGLYL